MDSDVCVDLLRLHPPALPWFASLAEAPAVPGFCAIELVVGADNRADQATVLRFLSRFQVIWPSQSQMDRALAHYAPLHLAHGLGALDALVAATSTGADAVLLTFNDRHFRAVPGIALERPYSR